MLNLQNDLHIPANHGNATGVCSKLATKNNELEKPWNSTMRREHE